MLTAIALTLSLLVHVANAVPAFALGDYSTDSNPAQHHSRRAVCANGKYPVYNSCCFTQCSCGITVCGCATMKTSSWGGIQCGSSCGNECVSCNVCTDCPAGKYGNNDECHDCAANKYTDQKSQTSCKNCNAGYYSNTGATFCAEVNECLSNPCQNGGVCDNQIDSYDCSCPAGYTGTNCQTNIDECASSPCQHGATCYDGVNGYTCTCVPGYTGTNCQTNIDECASNPCQNGATCVDLVNGYLCNCELGYDGTLCNNNINECASSPCQNGASCVDGVNGYTCTCVPGYNGILCSNNINECASVPCQNGATCVDVVNGYTCSCVPGYTGTLCESDMDECASSPCQNGAVCTQSIAYYTCACVAGYAGTNCETNVNECASNPCHNDATCVDGINGYTCSCAVGWFGLLCDVEVDECGSAPCVNGAECLDTLAGFLCTCVTGYTGIQCETNIDECASSPCQNFAACVDAVNAYSCICRAGYAGIHCETDIDECVSNPCQNSGTCVDAVNGYSCTCPVDYYGTECAEFDDCYAEPCLNGASCAESGTAYECTCAAGYDGDQCQVNIDECASSPCTNGGVCTDQVDAYACSCPQGFLGIHCETDSDECASTPCQNGAPCSNLPGAFFCDCTTGWYGEFCEADTNECASSPCTNGATCVDLQGTYECRCASGYRGVQCETDIDECSSSPCSNGASCADQVDGFVCTCASGFAGVVCETELNECDSSPCSNGANCTDALDGFVCTCASGFTGVVCESNVDECASSPCSNGASCNDQVDGFVCVCASGFTGNVCETNVDECLSSPCSNGANCTDAVDGFSCVCPSGFTGVVCESNVDECHSSPCSNGATCLNELDYFTCLCASGFTDSRCQTNVDECESAPCSNGATCLDGVDGFSCVCASGFVGIACESEVDECASSPCSNGANCTDAVDGFVCMCASGFTGVVCESNVDECASSPCTNGAVCSNNLDAYTCTCPSGFTGVDCETNVDECESSPCSNGASCVDGVDEYLCVCASGFTGTHCETEEDECASSPCQHGGVCTDHLDGFTCACPDNVHGVFCQSDCRAVSIITTQDRLNRLAGCWYTLTNNLTVSGSGITNLVGLYALETTNGTLRIENTLAPILYLDRLVQVSGHLEILNNPKLESAQLTELITVEGHLTLTGSPLLTTAPMNSIMTVGASPLTLSNLPLLDGASLDTLSKVPFAGVVTIENTGATSLALLNASTAITHLTVSSNAALTTLAGWESAATTLFSELASLSIDDNSALTSFTCPSLLFRFASTVSISISRNRALTTLDCSFATLTAASTVLLADDTSLTTLSGFHALTHASSVTLSNSGLVSVNELAFASLNTADLIISDNAKLLSLEASGFALAMNGSHTGSLTISGNEALLNVGFDHVITLHGSLTISDNERLVDIAGFQRLAMLNGTLTIANNTFLSVMTTIYVDQVPLNITGALHLTDNADLCVNELLDVLDQTVFVAGNVETNGTAQTGSPPCLLHALRVVAKGGVNSTEKADETIVKLTEVTDGDAWTSVQDAESASQIILKSLDNILVFVQRSNATNETTVESAAISNRTLSVLNNVLSPTSLGRINSGNSTANRIATVVESFVEILETVAICDGDALTLHGTNLNVEIQRSSNSSDLRRTYGDGSIMLPDEFAMVAGIPTRDCYDLQFIAYSTSPFVSTDKNATTTASNVVSFTVNNITVSGLTNETGILVTLTHTGAADGVDLACVYWDKVLGAWSTEGVTMVSQTATQTVCRTLHLTNFAMLALPTSRVSSLGSGATKALTVLTYLGCCASLVGIVFIWLTYYLVPSFRSHAIKLLLHLSVMLFMLNITFLAGIDATGNASACTFVAILLYFLLMAAFAWMLAISHNLYFLVVRVIGEPTSMMRYAVVCYCVPLAMTLALLVVDTVTDSGVGLGDANRCWISSDVGLYVAVLVPILLVVTINIVVFVKAIRALLASGRSKVNKSKKSGSDSAVSAHVKAVKLASGLLTSLGLAWFTAFVALATNEPVFWYFFVVLNASQGLLLAIFFVFLGRARKDLVKQIKMRNPMAAVRRNFTTFSTPSSATANTSSGGGGSGTLSSGSPKVKRGLKANGGGRAKGASHPVSAESFAMVSMPSLGTTSEQSPPRSIGDVEQETEAIREMMDMYANVPEIRVNNGVGFSDHELAQMHEMLAAGGDMDMSFVPASVMLQDHTLNAYIETHRAPSSGGSTYDDDDDDDVDSHENLLFVESLEQRRQNRRHFAKTLLAPSSISWESPASLLSGESDGVDPDNRSLDGTVQLLDYSNDELPKRDQVSSL